MPKTFKLNAKVNPNTGYAYERIAPIELGNDSATESFDSIADTDAPTPAFG